MPGKLTQEKVIAKFKAVWDDYYDYSKVEYVKSKAEVTIICPIHGEFEQTPYNHWNGHGCKKCARLKAVQSNTRSHEEWVATIAEKNPDVEVLGRIVNGKTKVPCLCKICGHKWPAAPTNLIKNRCPKKRSHGCPECRKLKVAQSRKLSHEEQVAAIYKVNPNIEILGKITGDKTPVLCRCKVCDHKWSPPPYELKKCGCPKCAGRDRTQEEWVEIIKKVNPNIEILGKIVNGKTPVLCLCKVCGHRWEPVLSELKRYGCSKCANHGFLSHEQGHLYVMVDDLEAPTMMKVGVSIHSEKRKNEVLNSAKKSGVGLSTLHVIKTWEGPTEDIRDLEKAIHQILSQYKINFPAKFNGCQEFFYYRPEVFELIEEHLKKFATEE